jgi:hypothetical protein
MAAAAVPAGEALDAMQRFGRVSECAVYGEGGRLVEISGPQALSIADQVQPFLHHPSRRVVVRAAGLLCALPLDAPDLARELRSVAQAHPCEQDLISSARARVADCEGNRRRPGDDLYAPRAELGAWRAKVPAPLIQRLERGEASAWLEVEQGLDSFDRSAAQRAAGAVAAVSTPVGMLRALALAERLEMLRSAEEQLAGALGMALERIAAAMKVEPEEAFVETVRQAPLELFPKITWLESALRVPMDELARAARRARRSTGNSRAGAAHLERLADHLTEDWHREVRRIEGFAEVRDRPALRAYVRDEENLWQHRILAAVALAELRDPGGLFLFESSDGLEPLEARMRKEELERIARKAQGEAAARAAALLASPSWARLGAK